MESTDSSIGSPPPQPYLPPGFRFHPTDEELVVHYLKKKATSAPLPVAIIADIDLYKFDPWELPAKAMFGEQEWYFFSPRDRKYPNGTRPNRAATSGYWKATGTDKPVLTSGGTHKVGVKKALVFYGGKPPKGIKTSWIMHEYRLTDNNKPNNKPPAGCDAGKMKNSLRLDDWVLCRIYQKNNAQRMIGHDRDDHVIGSAVQQQNHVTKFHCPNNKPAYYGSLLENENHMLDSILGSEVTAAMVQQPSASRLPLKRTLPSLWWSDVNPSAAAGKTATAEGNSSAIGTLLEHLPHTPPQLLQQSLFGVLGDGVFRQQFQLSDMNWYS